MSLSTVHISIVTQLFRSSRPDGGRLVSHEWLATNPSLFTIGGLTYLDPRFDHYPDISGSLSAAIIGINLIFYHQGLAEYVLQHVQDAKSRGLVIGHDHRYNSEHWAHLTTQAFIAKGIKVYGLQGLNHTPM